MHTKKTTRILFIFCLFCIKISFFDNSQSYAQNSVIDKIQRSLPSFVTVTAKNRSIFKSPNISAAFDKKSGRLIIGREVKAASYDRIGAGVIIDRTGIIVTNAHTIVRSDSISVILNDHTKVSAQPVFIAENHDLALIKITPPYPLKIISIANSDKIRLGDDIFSIGNSEILKHTLSGGKVIGLGTSSIARKKGISDTLLIQTTIYLYKGDSGGPLLNRKGQLIGLMVAEEMNAAHSSFAIPSNVITEDYEKYIRIRK